MKKKILITGISGLLGNNLAYFFKDRFDVLGMYHEHPVYIAGTTTKCVDLLSERSLSEAVNKFCPDIVIHCASLTNVDFCEEHQRLARQVNVDGTKNVVQSIRGSDALLVYISTDSVYDGIKGHFSEDDGVSPLNYYGKSKLEGEQEASQHRHVLTLRTNIFGWNIQQKMSLGEWILASLGKAEPFYCFDDAYFSTLYTFKLAEVLECALEKKLTGIYNCASSSSLSKYGFALQLANLFHFDPSLVRPISIDQFGFKARRGKKLSLNVRKLEEDIGRSLPTIEESLQLYQRDYGDRLPSLIRRKNADPLSKQHPVLSYGHQWIDNDDIQAVSQVLRAPFLTKGPKVEEFEEALSCYVGARFAVAVNSGTSALHIACLAAGVRGGDEVITSPNTFVASANCAAYCGAKPVFADIDPSTYNISPAEIERHITEKTKTIIPVHFAGQSCDLKSIYNLKQSAEKKYGQRIFIIEDASHALGSLYQGERVGCCRFSDMVVMSFHPVKHITTGEGGVVFTNDEELYCTLKRFRSHGIAEKYEIEKTSDPWHYEQVDLGYNYRITDIQCALGISQLKKLPQFIQRRRELFNFYRDDFQNCKNMKLPIEVDGCQSNFHLYVVLFDFERIGMDRKTFMEKLGEKGIQTQVHYIPVHTQPYHQKTFGYRWGDYPHAEKYYERCLSLPLFPAMTDEDAERVVLAVKNYLL